MKRKSILNLRRNTKKTINVLQDLFGNNLEVDSNNHIISPKKKLICLLLVLFLGFFGLHRFYLGQYKHFCLHVGSLAFCYLCYLYLPDYGLFLLVLSSSILWLIADVLAIIFSNIFDAQKRIVKNWI